MGHVTQLLANFGLALGLGTLVATSPAGPTALPAGRGEVPETPRQAKAPSVIPSARVLYDLFRAEKLDVPSIEGDSWLLEECLHRNSGKHRNYEMFLAGCAKDLNLSPEAAEKLIRAFLASKQDRWGEKPAEVLEATADLYQEAVTTAPESRVIRTYAMRFVGERARFNEVKSFAPVVRLVEASPNPTQTALDYASFSNSEGASIALGAALKVRPGNALLLLKASEQASGNNDPALSAALAEAGYLALEAPGESEIVAIPLISRRINELGRCGLAGEVVACWKGLTQNLQEALVRSFQTRTKLSFQGETSSFKSVEEVGTTLALALIQTGDREVSRGLIEKLKRLHPKPGIEKTVSVTDQGKSPMTIIEKTVVDEDADRFPLQANLIGRFLDATKDDPFDLVVQVISGHAWSGNNLSWEREVLGWTRQEGYEQALEGMRASHHTSVQSFAKPSGSAGDHWPAMVMDRANVLRMGIRSTDLPTGPETRKLQAPILADAVGDRVHALLERPRVVPFTEHALPAGTSSDKSEEGELSQGTKRLLKKVHFPSLFQAVRAEIRDKEVVVLGVSQALDPVGEVSAGGYWVVRSHNAGKSWMKPHYTGLQVYKPYLVKSRSSLPMIRDGHLQLEVAVRELDEQSITFPPLGIRVKRSADGLYLDFPWAELEKDSDGDGLTDLEEEKLLTDPQSRDTDGDGVDDGVDSLPLVYFRSDLLNEEPGAMVAVLNQIGFKESEAIVPGLPGSQKSMESVIDRMLKRSIKAIRGTNHATFICGDRSKFTGLSTNQRIIVLTPAERDQFRRKFGVFYPMNLETFVFDRVHRRAYCIWSASWTGGAMRLTKQGAKWVATVTSDWIT